MLRSKKPTVSREEVKARFEGWRRNRKGKAPIPDELWAAAVDVARREGVSRTSTELRVEWNHLKRRMAEASGASLKPVPPRFVELVAATRGIAVRMCDRTGRPPREAANPVEGCFGFVPSNAEPGTVGVGVLIQITRNCAYWWR